VQKQVSGRHHVWVYSYFVFGDTRLCLVRHVRVFVSSSFGGIRDTKGFKLKNEFERKSAKWPLLYVLLFCCS
jgi:hypothetical protein